MLLIFFFFFFLCFHFFSVCYSVNQRQCVVNYDFFRYVRFVTHTQTHLSFAMRQIICFPLSMCLLLALFHQQNKCARQSYLQFLRAIGEQNSVQEVMRWVVKVVIWNGRKKKFRAKIMELNSCKLIEWADRYIATHCVESWAGHNDDWA